MNISFHNEPKTILLVEDEKAVRTLARRVAEAYYQRRESLGFPMLATAGTPS